MPGRGFYARLCKVSCEEGLKVSKIAPGLYYVLGSDNLPAVLLGTHVDDLLWCATPEGEAIMERIMAKFDMGKVEDTDFRYCGRRLRQDEDFNVTIDTEDNTRPIRHIVIDPNRKSTEPATDRDITRLRSVVGSLAWVARYSRPDLCYRVNCLQRACARATVADLRDANRVVDLAKADAGISMFYPAGKFSWHDACVVSFSDASHAGEERVCEVNKEGSTTLLRKRWWAPTSMLRTPSGMVLPPFDAYAEVLCKPKPMRCNLQWKAETGYGQFGNSMRVAKPAAGPQGLAGNHAEGDEARMGF